MSTFYNTCVRAGIDVILSSHITVDIWSKFSFLAPLSGITALTRRPIGLVRSDPDTRTMFQKAIEEVVQLVTKKGIPLKEDIVLAHMAQLDKLPHEAGSSQLQDLLQGKRLELPWLSGAVSQLGKTLGVSTPYP